MTISEASKDLKRQLSALYDERESAKITDMIMESLTGLSKTERLIQKEKAFNRRQQEQLKHFRGELLDHKPVQYVLHEAWFAGMKFYVNEYVLIPRPETEELVEYIISDLLLTTHHASRTILDIGTGSGCIAVALKKKIKDSLVYALDISSKSLAIAQKNATTNSVDIEFLKADILNMQQGRFLPQFDIIVSNPPYIKQTEAKEMAPNVLLFEPKEALFVPDSDALLFYKAIAGFALQHLKPCTGKLYFEINEMMGEQVAALLKQKGFSSVSIKKDIQGKERIVSAILK
jgi:release factor glutamine methyltransferase